MAVGFLRIILMNLNNFSSPSFGMAFKQTAEITDVVGELSSRALKAYDKGANAIHKLSEKPKIGVDITFGIDGADKFCANLVSKNDSTTIKTIVYDKLPDKARNLRKLFRSLKTMIKDFSRFCDIKSKFGE